MKSEKKNRLQTWSSIFTSSFLQWHIAALVLTDQSFELQVLRQQLSFLLLQLVYVFGSLLEYRGLKIKN